MYDANVAAGVVISQQPEAGKSVVENSVIVVKVSLGAEPQVATMSDLKNRSKEWALSYLDSLKMDLKIEFSPEYNETVDENNIIKTEPGEGATLTVGQTVVLYISQGKKIEFGGMPMVVNNTKEEATKILNDQGLGLKIVYDEVWDMTIPAGIVMESTPTRGERLKTGQTVTLKVSKGVERVLMPDLTGLEVEQAKSMVTDLGLQVPAVVYVDSAEPKDTVLTQSLDKDVEYEITATVTLEVSNGSKAPVTKTVTIDLRNSALFGECRIVIKKKNDGKEIYSGTVPKGTLTVTLPEQTEAGAVTYSIIINETDGWDVVEVFTANG